MEDKEWWKDAIVYQIYPRSFQDSNGDGVGDLRGIIRRLNYIKELGADVIWLCPIYASPNADNGYDISDYRTIQPEFGTMEDFDLLLKEVHLRGMRLIMDLVVNHTSDEHAWFKESRQSRENAYRDYYIWRNGVDGHEPNNWVSWFSGPAWEWNEDTGDYYLHIFHKKQPDLNWRNPQVREDVFQMMSWWLDKGVDGFRMDVISLISKPKELPDSTGGELAQYCVNGPCVHEYLREMNEKVLSRYDCMTVGECPNITVEEAQKYAGADRQELNMVFQFEHTTLSDGPNGKWSDQRPYLPDLKRIFKRWQNGLRDNAWNCLFWSNHDQPRAVSKFGCDQPEYRTLSAKMLCACLYLMQGTPYIYQGEELGMTNAGFKLFCQYKDVESLNAYRELVDSGKLSAQEMLRYLGQVSRDNARTPMQWSGVLNAGFSSADPWIGMAYNWRDINAEQERSDPDSVFCFYQKVLNFRKGNPIIRDGSFTLLCPEHEQVFAYFREWNGKRLYIICNFSSDCISSSIPTENFELLLGNYPEAPISLLRPYEVAVFKQARFASQHHMQI